MTGRKDLTPFRRIRVRLRLLLALTEFSISKRIKEHVGRMDDIWAAYYL